MYYFIFLASVLFFPSVKALSILLPLWSWPDTWQPVYSAIEGSPNVLWQIVINPNSGPDTTGDHPAKPDYAAGVAKLNTYHNVILIGYVRTQYMQRSNDTVKTDVNTYASWNSYQPQNVSIAGIFFDEVTGKDAYNDQVQAYYGGLSAHVKSTFKSTVKPVVFNPGALGPEPLFGVCDVMIEFEGWAKEYQDPSTIAKFPSGQLSKVGIMAYNTEALPMSVPQAVHGMAQKGIGTVFFDYVYVAGSEGKPTGNYKTFRLEDLKLLADAVAAG